VGADLALQTSLQTIGLAVSSDGHSFSPPAQVLVPDQNLYPRDSGWIGFSTPSAAVFENQVHVFADVAREIPDWTQVALHHFASADGRTGFIHDTAAIFTREDFANTRREIRSIVPFLEGDNLRIYFAGDNFYTVVNGDTTWHPETWGIWSADCDLTPMALAPRPTRGPQFLSAEWEKWRFWPLLMGRKLKR
jgi:hypothetical protein